MNKAESGSLSPRADHYSSVHSLFLLPNLPINTQLTKINFRVNWKLPLQSMCGIWFKKTGLKMPRKRVASPEAQTRTNEGKITVL